MKRKTYAQSTDRTLSPFMRKGEEYVGSPALKKQLKGEISSADDVRVKAMASSRTQANEGLHEVLPTDLRDKFPGNDVFASIQSGLRTSPSLTPFRQEDGRVTGHTQTFIKPGGGPGSTHTSDQSVAHDRTRNVFKKLQESKAPFGTAVVELFSTHLQGMAHGESIISSDFITDALPNSHSASGALEPVSTPPGRSRLGFAIDIDASREAAKRRIHAYDQQTSVISPRSLSPLRAPLKADGTRGDVLAAPFPLPAIPDFSGAFPLADAAAWLTEPLRQPKAP